MDQGQLRVQYTVMLVRSHSETASGSEGGKRRKMEGSLSVVSMSTSSMRGKDFPKEIDGVFNSFFVSLRHGHRHVSLWTSRLRPLVFFWKAA